MLLSCLRNRALARGATWGDVRMKVVTHGNSLQFHQLFSDIFCVADKSFINKPLLSCFVWCKPHIINWLIGMLLVSRSGLVEENAVEIFHHYGVHLSSWCRVCWLAGLCYNGHDMEEYKRLCIWLIVMKLVSRSGLVEKNAVEMFHHYGVHLPFFNIDANFQLVGRTMLLRIWLITVFLKKFVGFYY